MNFKYSAFTENTPEMRDQFIQFPKRKLDDIKKLAINKKIIISIALAFFLSLLINEAIPRKIHTIIPKGTTNNQICNKKENTESILQI